jgi:hypothetical protein
MTTSLRRSKGIHMMGVDMYTSTVDVETIMSTTRRSPLTRRHREWSEQQKDSSKKYR